MGNYITTGFLNLRSAPVIDNGNILAIMPPDLMVEEHGESGEPGWLKLKAVLHSEEIEGYASLKYLLPIQMLLPATQPEIPLPEVHYYPRNRSVGRNHLNAWAYPLNEPELMKVDLKQITTAKERAVQIHNMINFLDVEHSQRYAPNAGSTYCNIYAYDVAYCLGAYIPRVWWTANAIADLKSGQDVKPAYGDTVTELTANRITDWFEQFGASSGWQRLSDVKQLQQEVNKGMLGIIVAQRIHLNTSGHIVIVVPETNTLKAKRLNRKVVSPLQSQAGVKNQQYFTDNNWWQDEEKFKKFGFWVYKPV